MLKQVSKITVLLHLPGKELLERLSSSLESALNVDTDLADPELTDPLPEIKSESMKVFSHKITSD